MSQDFTKPETFAALSCLARIAGDEPEAGKPSQAARVACIALAIIFEDEAEYSDPQKTLEDCARILDPLGASGVEHCMAPASHTSGFSYVNLGDTYSQTIILETDDQTFRIGSWGDYLEELEQEHTEETGEDRCSYCGEWSEGPCHLEDGTRAEDADEGRECCGVAQNEPCEGWYKKASGTWVSEWEPGHDCDCEPAACTHVPCKLGPYGQGQKDATPALPFPETQSEDDAEARAALFARGFRDADADVDTDDADEEGGSNVKA